MAIAPYVAKLYAIKAMAFENATKRPFETQRQLLFELLARNKNTVFGIKHDFAHIRSIEQYQLQGNRYKLLRKIDTGKLKSIAVSGFEMPVPALFDEAEKKKALQKIIVSSP